VFGKLKVFFFEGNFVFLIIVGSKKRLILKKKKKKKKNVKILLILYKKIKCFKVDLKIKNKK